MVQCQPSWNLKEMNLTAKYCRIRKHKFQNGEFGDYILNMMDFYLH